MYVDLEQHKDAIEVYDRALQLFEKVIAGVNSMTHSEAIHMSVVPVTLEQVAIMKQLAEEYIKDGQFVEGI